MVVNRLRRLTAATQHPHFSSQRLDCVNDWLACILGFLYVIAGVPIYSGLLFVNVLDAVMMLLRYLASVFGL